MKHIMLSLLALLCLSSFTEKPTDKKKITANTSTSTFMYGLDHPLHSFEAVSKDFKCIAAYDTESKKLSVIAVIVAVKSFDSGNGNRDSHVIEAVRGLKYPNITFSADKITYSGNDVTASGKLVFHGQSKPFTIKATQSSSDGQLALKGAFEVDMTTFGVKPPSLMGMSTDKQIKLSFEMKFAT